MESEISFLVNDRIIHERARLLILTYLASKEENWVTFNEIKEAVGLTSGNLSVQLKTISNVKYIMIQKEFIGNKPMTRVSLTSKGRSALKTYFDQLNNLIVRLRS